MGYLIGLLVVLLFINIIINICADEEPAIFPISLLLTILIIVFTILFSQSDFTANKVIKSYEKGEYKKVITINEQDTTLCIQMQIVTAETAKSAAEKGYRDNPWDDNYHKIPYQAELQDWLRNVHHIHIYTDIEYLESEKLNAGIVPKYLACGSNTKDGSGIFSGHEEALRNTYNTHEEALEAGLQEALKLI